MRDHFVLANWIEEPANLTTRDLTDFDDPNSPAIDRDGHYVASFRHLAEITRLDYRTGEINWRFGGRNDQFAIEEDRLGGFNGQHSVRVLGNGNLLLFDNGLRHDPSETRAVEYRLDNTAMTATLLQLRSLYGYERP